MKNLLDIIRTVTNNGMTKRDLFSEFSDPNSLQHKLVLGITDGTFINDEEAIHTLYKKTDSASKRSYKQLKYNVRNKLLGLLFIMPDEEGALNTPRKARTQALKLAAAGQILFINSFTTTAEEVLVQAAQIAKEYECFDVEYHALYFLQSHYSTQGNPLKLSEVQTRCRYLLEMLQAETEAKELFHHFAVVANTTSGTSERAIAVGEEVVNQLEVLVDKYPCFSIRNRYVKTFMFFSMLRREFDVALDAVKNTISLLEEYPKFANNTLYADSYMQMSNCLYELKEYDEAVIIITKAIQLSKSFTNNWANTLFYYVLILLRIENLNECAKVIQEAKEYIAEGGGTQLWREQMMVLHGYFYVVCTVHQRIGVTIPNDVMEIVQRYSHTEFMSNSPTITRDKRGSNIARVILDVLCLLLQSVDIASTRTEALRQYKKSYLRGSNYARSSAIFSLLELLIENNADITLVSKLGKRYITALEPSAKNHNAASECIEPIEYRRIWQLLVLYIQNTKSIHV